MVKINTESDTSDVRKKLKAEILSARKETTAEKEKVARRERANIKLNPDEKKTLDEMMREERWEGTVSSYIKTKIFIPRAKENPVPEARKAEAEDLLRGLNLRLEYLLKVQAKVLGKIETAVEKFQYMVAIEIYVALQALDFLKPLEPSPVVQTVRDYVRREVPFVENDRFLYPDIVWILAEVRNGSLIALVEKQIGKLLF